MSSPMINQYAPDSVSPPGETLLEILESRQMSQAELADRTGRPKKTINEIVHGKAQITAETAIQFERVFGIPASFWIAREQNYREWLARGREAIALSGETEWLTQMPYRSLVRLGWVRDHSSKGSQVEELLKFFAVASPASWKDVWTNAVAFRESPSFVSHPGAVAAWLRRGEIVASGQKCASFDENGFRSALTQIRSLSRAMPRELPVLMRDLCNSVGVALAFVPEVSGTRLWGASRWITPQCAFIQLSLRYKTDDHFWFTFFHEAAHVLLHPRRDIYLDEDGEVQGIDREEEANEFSRNWLIPDFQYKQFCRRGSFTCTAAERLAFELGISPGIVVGRLQREDLADRRSCNDLKKDVSWIFEESER